MKSKIIIDAVEIILVMFLLVIGIYAVNYYIIGATYLLLMMLCWNVGCDYVDINERQKKIKKTN